MECLITIEQAYRFACLSGDFNPIHIDPVRARRLRFGVTVAHGINVLLVALDNGLAGRNAPCRLKGLKVNFSGPIPTGEKFKIAVVESAPDKLRMEVIGPRGAAATIEADLALGMGRQLRLAGEHEHGTGVPRVLAFKEAANAGGKVPLVASPMGVAEIFPTAFRCLPLGQIATLLATTRIVGMECPGEHSIFIGLDLRFICAADAVLGAALSYKVERADERFDSLHLHIQGPGVVGRLTTLFRATPVSQLPFAKVREHTPGNAFAGQRALVIGGSRGLGEVTAKVVAAGGGETAITYRLGKTDAQAVAAEISARGGRCVVAHYDVEAPANNLKEALPVGWNPTHVYYFGTPLIRFNRGAWDANLFRQFVRFYVDGFAVSVSAIEAQFPDASERRVFVYPSTSFLAKPPGDGMEYVAAKAAGEVLCKGLMAKMPSITIMAVRLPRVLTDQTGAVQGGKPPSAFALAVKLVTDAHRAGLQRQAILKTR